MARSTHTKIENAIATTTPLTRHQLICIACLREGGEPR
jgi:hypothetical protein